MSNLQEAVFLKVLKVMMKDEAFLKSLIQIMDSVLTINPDESYLNEELTRMEQRVNQRFRISQEEESTMIPGFQESFIAMLREKQFLAFARVFTMLRNTFSYPDERIMNYLKKLKFQTKPNWKSTSPWVNIRETSTAIKDELNPARMKILNQLTDTQRFQLRSITPERLDIMSNFSPAAVDILSRLIHLSSQQRVLIINLSRVESRVLAILGSVRIRFLSTLPIDQRRELLRSCVNRDNAGITRFLERHGLDEQQRSEFLTALSGLEAEQLNAFEEIFEGDTTILGAFPEEAINLAGRIHELSDEERDYYLELDPTQLRELDNLSEDRWRKMMNFQEGDPPLAAVLKVANGLTSEERNLILSLNQEQLGVLVADGTGSTLTQVRDISLINPGVLSRFSVLTSDEENAILRLTVDERSTLSRAFSLGHDGLRLMNHLGFERTNRVFNPEAGTNGDDLNTLQKALKQKLASLDEPIELTRLFRIMGYESRDTLMNLSWAGIETLRRLVGLNTATIDAILNLSNNGLRILNTNDGLSSEQLSALASLDEREGRVLMNLNLDQREYLSHGSARLDSPLLNEHERQVLGNLSEPGRRALSGIIALSDREIHFLDCPIDDKNFLTSMDARALNLLATLNANEVSLISSSINWNFEEDTVFTLLGMELKSSLDERYIPIERYLQRIPAVVQGYGIVFKLIANTIEIQRLTGVLTDQDVENILTLMELNCGNLHALIFKFQLLNVSMRDSRSLESLLGPQILGNEVEIASLCQSNKIETIEDVMFMRWILSQSADLNGGIFMDIAGISITMFSENISIRALKLVLTELKSETDGIVHDRVLENFRNLLREARYSLTASFFFRARPGADDSESSRLIMTILSEILTPEDCFEFLRIPIMGYMNDGMIPWVRDHGHPNIFTDERFREANVFETSLYYGQGYQRPLLEMLDTDQQWSLIRERPETILELMVKGYRRDLLELFENVEDAALVMLENRQAWTNSLTHGLTLDREIIPIEVCTEIADMIRHLACVGGLLDRAQYLRTVSDYVVNIRTRVSRDVLSQVLNRFVTLEVRRIDLVYSLANLIEQDLFVFLHAQTGQHCMIQRRKRALSTVCKDSRNTKELTSVEAKQVLEDSMDVTQSEYVELYDQFAEYYDGKLDVKALISKIKDIPLDKLDPRIKPVALKIRNNFGDETKIRKILRQSGIAMKITKVADSVGAGFTYFLVMKDVLNGDPKALGEDLLNFWVMPKIGREVTTILTDFAVRNNYAVIERSAPIIGDTIGSLAAIYGFIEGIRERWNAVDPVDMKLADLNIVTNAIFIAANIPMMSSLGVEISVMGGLAGPLGLALTVSVMIISYLTNAGFQVEKVGEHIRLTSSEKKTLYGRFLLGKSGPEYLRIDRTAKDMYAQYFNDYLKRFKGEYDGIAISLPSFSITKKVCVKNTGPRFKRGIHYCVGCQLGTESTSFAMDFHEKVYARDPFKVHTNRMSRILTDGHDGYDIVCGPSTDDAKERSVDPNIPDTCPPDSVYHDTKWMVEMKELFLPPIPDNDCINIVSFRKQGPSNSTRKLLYIVQDASIALSKSDSVEMFFQGTNISITDSRSTETVDNISENIYHFQSPLQECSIHRKGHNFFYLNEKRLNCDLGKMIDQQHNVVVIRNNFTDSEGIHSIVGSDHEQKIKADFAEYIDGHGGGDVIEATKRTVVKGYFNDFIIGESPVLLPLNVSDIGYLLITTRMSIHNKTGAWIGVDRNTPVITADNYFLTPIRFSNVTHKVTHAHIKKTLKGAINVEDELNAMRDIKIPNCTLVKQLSSVDYDIILNDVGRNIFHPDKPHHSYYWESSGEDGNTYIFGKLFANITVSKANGILNFQSFMLKFERIKQHLVPKQDGGIRFPIGGLHVNLLPNYKNMTFTFDGKEYYKLQDKIMIRDWCPLGMPVIGRMAVDGIDVQKHLTCFEFDSRNVLFLKLADNLLLVSGAKLLIILKYYSTIHEEKNLSLKLKDRIMKPHLFYDNANKPHKMIYYKPNNSRLQIYHNQPVDERHIGLIDFKDRSIKDFQMIVKDPNLLLLFRKEIIVEIEDWKYYQPSRRIMFAFKDSFLRNAGCVTSQCKPEDIIEEFEIDKARVGRVARSSAGCKSSWINDLVNAIVKPFRNTFPALAGGAGKNKYLNRFDAAFGIANNINLIYVLLQHFLDKNYPLPKAGARGSMEDIVDVIGLTEEYERIVNDTARRYDLELKDLNSFKLYSDIVELVRTEVFHDIPKVLYSAAAEIYPRHEEFLIDLRINIQRMLTLL